MQTSSAIAAWQDELAEKTPLAIVRAALTAYPQLAISFSGAEDVVLIELARQTGLPFQVFTLDTGRLHPETLTYLETVRQHFQLSLTVLSPEASAVEQLVREKGLFSFYQDNHQECCGIRKVAPLKRHLAQQRAWMTGQRRDQSPGTRQAIPVVQEDPAFTGIDGQPLIKFNPLANWTSAEVWSFIRMLELPYNPLHAQGYISLGCAPCTRPVLPGQHEREGRWWWEEATQKECGLHAGNAPQAG